MGWGDDGFRGSGAKFSIPSLKGSSSVDEQPDDDPRLDGGKAAEKRGRIVQGNPLFHFLDFSFYFFCPLGIELFFIWGKLAEQSQKFSHVYKSLVRYFLDHFHGELVVGWVPEPAERGPPAPAPEWPRNAVIPITYRPVPD